MTTAANLYFHYPCFDGIISGVIAWDFLEAIQGWNIESLHPVNYDIRDAWLQTDLRRSAVVDFLYHPQAEFWADHHLSSFITQSSKMDFERRKRKALWFFDNQAASCASLLWRSLARFLPENPRYKEMVLWSEKIDSATYSSVEEAILGSSPALQIRHSLMLSSEPEYGRFLLTRLRRNRLEDIAQLPEVRSRCEEARSRISAGLKRVGDVAHLEEGGIVTFDVQAKDDEVVSQFSPYYFFPNAAYSVGTIRLGTGTKITAMRNPWQRFDSIPLGKLFQEYGGGGHQRIGSVFIPSEHSERIPNIVHSVICRIRCNLNFGVEGVVA